jgi:hypothetical protein
MVEYTITALTGGTWGRWPPSHAGNKGVCRKQRRWKNRDIEPNAEVPWDGFADDFDGEADYGLRDADVRAAWEAF